MAISPLLSAIEKFWSVVVVALPAPSMARARMEWLPSDDTSNGACVRLERAAVEAVGGRGHAGPADVVVRIDGDGHAVPVDAGRLRRADEADAHGGRHMCRCR